MSPSLPQSPHTPWLWRSLYSTPPDPLAGFQGPTSKGRVIGAGEFASATMEIEAYDNCHIGIQRVKLAPVHLR